MSNQLPLNPTGFRLLVEIIRMEKTTKGGIIIADTIAERRDQAGDKGVIVAIGKDAWKSFDDGEPWAAVGDTVLLKRYVGTIFNYKEKKYTIINDEEVLGVIPKEVNSQDIEL